jgi:hypothetical protein
VKGKTPTLVSSFLMGICLSTRADAPVFGNAPNGQDGFGIVLYNQQCLSAGAVEFTPEENIDLSSITLWLSDYTGQNGQTINVGIYANDDDPHNNPGNALNFPDAPYLYFSTPAPNDGSLAAFNFCHPTGSPINNPSDSTVLLANTPYWLLVTAGGQPGDYLCTSGWTGGGALMGDATYNQSDDYNNGGYDDSTLMPAFTLNAVPEPGFATLMTIPLMFGMARGFYQRRKACS